MPKTLYVLAAAGSVGERDIEIKLGHTDDGDTCEDVLKLTVLRVRLKSLDFLGADNHLLRKQNDDEWENDAFGDSGDVLIDYAEWQDPDLDGSPDKTDPACYTRGSQPVMNVVLGIEPFINPGVTATLSVKHGSPTVSTRELTLLGSEVSVTDMMWQAPHKVGDILEALGYLLDWRLAVYGEVGTCSIGVSETEIFTVFDTPFQVNSAGEANSLTCTRLDEVIYVAGATPNLSMIASKIQQWRDDPDTGIDTSGITAHTADEYWALLDGVGKGQCAQGSLLMEQAGRLLGVPAEYQHVLAAVSLPVPVHTITAPASPPQRTHCGTTEYLLLYFSDAGNFTGWNYGEGCCLVDGRLYTAWAGGLVGEAGASVGGRVAESAAHHVLLELEGDYNDLQRWQKSNGEPCDTADTVPVP